MNLRQKVLKILYPLTVLISKNSSKFDYHLKNFKNIKAPAAVYALQEKDLLGNSVAFEKFKGKKILIVNTASFCGFTNQYKELQELYNSLKDKIVILAFPSNDFKNQEEFTEQQIGEFCQINFNITFPIFKKSSVLQPAAGSMYEWLTNPAKNGWNSKKPGWNFAKYIIDKQGNLEHVCGTTIIGKKLFDLLVI